jgi:hypothetical protein
MSLPPFQHFLRKHKILLMVFKLPKLLNNHKSNWNQSGSSKQVQLLIRASWPGFTKGSKLTSPSFRGKWAFISWSLWPPLCWKSRKLVINFSKTVCGQAGEGSFLLVTSGKYYLPGSQFSHLENKIHIIPFPGLTGRNTDHVYNFKEVLLGTTAKPGNCWLVPLPLCCSTPQAPPSTRTGHLNFIITLVTTELWRNMQKDEVRKAVTVVG